DVSRSSCAPCHGESAPRDLGVRDWDGDGRAEPLIVEYRRALFRVRERMRASIAAEAIPDRCGPTRTAAACVDSDARLMLVDAAGHLLGDCDTDGRIGVGESPISVGALPRTLADAAHDLAMLERDGSSGVHNPEYAFRILAGLDRALP